MDEIVFTSEGDYCLSNIIITCLSIPLPQPKEQKGIKKCYIPVKKVSMDNPAVLKSHINGCHSLVI